MRTKNTRLLKLLDINGGREYVCIHIYKYIKFLIFNRRIESVRIWYDRSLLSPENSASSKHVSSPENLAQVYSPTALS